MDLKKCQVVDQCVCVCVREKGGEWEGGKGGCQGWRLLRLKIVISLLLLRLLQLLLGAVSKSHAECCVENTAE